jgi:4-carboxymuconolactone decarboxylase
MTAMDRLLAAAALTLALPLLTVAQSPPLVVLSSNATRVVLQQLTPALERTAGRGIELKFSNSIDLRTRIQQGERFDVAVLAASAIDALAADSFLAPSSRIDFARAGVGVAIRKGATPPDISTPDKLKQAFLAARSVAYVGQGATAPIVRAIFDRLGIAAEMQAKVRIVPGGAAEVVARGEAEIGLTQISEILPVAGAALAGPLPDSLQVYTVFSAAVAAKSPASAAARRVLTMLIAPSSAGAITASGMQPVGPPNRLPPIPVSQMTDAQRKAAEEFKVIRKGAEVSGPFFPLLRSPELMVRTSALGEYLRYRSTLPPRLSEFVILLTARAWTQQYEWNAHYGIALKAGVSAATANAIAEGRKPADLAADHEALYEFCQELLATKGVSDATYQRALALFGEQGVVDTVGIVGYYSMLAMVLNTARTPGGDSAAPVLQALPK